MVAGGATPQPCAPQADPRRGGALDGGWGWACVLGCALMHFLLGGYGRSYGLVYVKMLERFECSAALGSAIGGIFTAIRMGCGPLVGALARRWSARSVTAMGALMFAASCGLCALATSPIHMLLSYSLLGGLGGALIYFPAVVMVGQYFERWRGAAMGLSAAGSGVGCVVVPPLVRLLFDEYGQAGAYLVLSALLLHLLVCATLYRPLAQSWRGRRPAEGGGEGPSGGEKGDEDAPSDHDDAEVAQQERVASTPATPRDGRGAIPLAIPWRRSVAYDADSLLVGDACSLSVVDLASLASLHLPPAVRRTFSLPDEPYAPLWIGGARGGRRASEVPRGFSVQAEPRAGGGSRRHSSGDMTGAEPPQGRVLGSGTGPKSSGEATPWSKASLLLVSELDTEVELESATNPATSLATPPAAPTSCCSRKAHCCSRVSLYFGCALLSNPLFACYVAALSLATMAYMSAQNLVVAHALDVGVATDQAVYILSIIGAADTLGRVLAGLLYDVPAVRRVRGLVFAFILLGSGLSLLGWAWCADLGALAALSALNGVLNGAIVTGRPVVLADIVGVGDLAAALGLTVCAQGACIFVGPLIAGLLRDISGTYKYSFIFTGLCCCFGTLVYTLGYWLTPRRTNHRPEHQQ